MQGRDSRKMMLMYSERGKKGVLVLSFVENRFCDLGRR